MKIGLHNVGVGAWWLDGCHEKLLPTQYGLEMVLLGVGMYGIIANENWWRLTAFAV
jgi:hypothetical protein